MTHTAVSTPPTPVRPTGGTADWLPSVAAASVSAGAIARQVPQARLVILPGVGHELPRPLWPTLVGHIRDNAERARVPAS